MSVPRPKASVDVHFETPPHPQPSRSKLENQYQNARVTFDKTIEGHYRHGTTGYKRVGALFLTWEKDDLQCKKTEVDALRELFKRDFKFETDYFEIPAERWQTGLLRKISDFIWRYDSRDCLAIIYYGGHGYIGEETKLLKLSAKIENDGRNPNGDETLFFDEITNCLRLPACDQVMIVDCCFSAKAFAREPIGKQKFELFTSAGAHDRVPSPGQPGSFTSALLDVLRKLLDANPKGFCTSQLYRELFHFIPQEIMTKPMLFDQSRQSSGKIWLRPQESITDAKSDTKDGKFLNLNLQLNDEPNDVVMNDLALALQYLPHVVKVRFVSLYAPRHQIEGFMRSVVLAQKLRPLVRRLHARIKLRKLTEMAHDDTVARPPASFLDILFKPISHPLYDWSSARRRGESSASRLEQPSSALLPSPTGQSHMNGTISNRRFSIDYDIDIPKYEAFKSRIYDHRLRVTKLLSRLTHSATDTLDSSSPSIVKGKFLYTELLALDARDAWTKFLEHISPDDAWHGIMWIAVWYATVYIYIYNG